MKPINLGQIKLIHTLKTKHQLDDDTYRLMIHAASDGRTNSSKELTFLEASHLIESLLQSDHNYDSCQRMRRKVIAMAREIGWIVKDQKRVDLKKIDGWCRKFSYLKKSLNRYTFEELPKLVRQFENGPYKHHLINL